MESGENYRLSGVSIGSSPNVWRVSGATEYFSKSKSSFDEVVDDEEALKWASIERLPTYTRLRTSVLTEDGGGGRVREVDVKHLSHAERKNVLERLVQFDSEKFLLMFQDRIQRVGVTVPTVEVRFENLSIETQAYVGGRALPTLGNFVFNIFESVLKNLHIIPSQKTLFAILNDVSGLLKPGRMALLLGPPGSGKTTLLKALAGEPDKDLKVNGRITYNGHEMHEFVPQRTSSYISQHDLHIGELTVRETLSFSARCQGVGSRHDILVELSHREKEANIMPDPDLDIIMKAAALEGQETNVVTDYIMKILGLEVCADTLVGSEMVRGVSGGQMKRVTAGEMMVGPSKVFLMDEISTGLDSSTTFQIVNSIRQSIHILQGTAVISLLQPAPETYDLFDDIILLSEGVIVYQGPRENVLEFFETMGFKCPPRKGVADFLQEVTSKKDQEQYWVKKDEPYEFVTGKKLSEAFHSFHVGMSLRAELAVPFDKSKSHPAALTTKKYGVSNIELLKACMAREFLLMKRNSFVYVFATVKLFLVAVIAMTLFLRTHMHKDTPTNGTVYMGALFFTLLSIMFSGFAETALTIMRLPVFYKQRDLFFYPAWAYALPTWLLKIPITLLESTLWVGMTYYVIGFDPSVSRFLRQYLLLICVSLMASGLFRFIGSIGRNMIVANTFGSFAILAVMVLGGFVISHDNIKKWWIWGYWISPLMYAQNAIAVNEFLGNSWGKVLPGIKETLGVTVLKARGVFAEAHWYWVGVGAMIGYMFLFNFIYALALTYLNPLEKPQAILSKESLEERTGTNSDKQIEMSSRGKKKDVERNVSPKSSPSRVGGKIAGQKEKRGMILPFQPFAITYDDVRYAVDMPPEMKAEGLVEQRLELLKGVSGSFRPGVLTALMGVSGAGKTTLMDVLAGRKTEGYIEGTITISGYPKKQDTFARIAGYCEQHDIHSPNLTVYESLQYSAWLRLPADVDVETREMFVGEVMELVELTPLKDALVGLPGVSGLSTEQRKRLTIAVELVANPSIIFMDEPTSGLDARAAAIVMRTIRNTVNTGRTVVCTIHQPSIDIFDAFDELVLLKRGGEEIYCGPLGHNCSQLIEYFQAIRGVDKIKDGHNPATWMLEVTTIAQEAALGVNFAELYKHSDLYQRNKALIKELSTPPPGSKDLYFPTLYSQPFFTQFKACLWKQHLSYWRNPEYNAVRMLFTTFIALLFGTIFWDLGTKRKKSQDLLNAMGSMYSAVIFMGVQNASSVQPVVAVERTVFYRERAAGMYSALAYAFAQIVVEFPYIFVQTMVYGVLVYAMIGFEWTAAKFFWYIFFMYFTFLYYTAYGMMAVAITPTQNVAAIVSSAFYIVWNLFSGFLIPKTAMPVWWRWYYYICPVAWTLYGLVASQFGDIKEEMIDTNQTVEVFIRDYFGFRHDFLGYVALIVVGIACLFSFIFAFSIKFLNYQKR